MEFSRTTPVANRPETSAGAPDRRCRLGDDLEIAYQSQAELAFFYEDIFEKEVYLRNGIALQDGACVFDVGANIGLFTLFVHRKFRGLQIYAFEPAPPLFEILRINTTSHGVNARLFNCGISNSARTASFTFYPNSSGMSSFHASVGEEKEVLRAIMNNQLRQGMAGMEQLMNYADDLLEERLKSETYECSLRTLSDVIREYDVQAIDLLKIDVQKSELDVARGINNADWKKIRQVVLEVHDFDGRLGEVTALLESKGFRLVVEQDDFYEGSILYNVYAIKPQAAGEAEPESMLTGAVSPAGLDEIRDRARKQKEKRRAQQLISRSTPLQEPTRQPDLIGGDDADRPTRIEE
jgi:FkbM family methyltransferase